MKYKKYLNEESIVDAAADAMNAETIDLTDEEGYTELEQELDRALARNMGKLRRAQKRGKQPDEFVNVLVTGPAGIGKTAIVKQWARKRGVRIVQQDAKSMDVSDIGGAVAPDRETGKRAIKLGTTQFDQLDEIRDGQYAVLFLDELNRADPQVRGSLLTLINNHEIPDPEDPSGMRFLRGFLFTVAAVNPSGEGIYNTADPFDPAELSRFLMVDMKPSASAVLRHLIDDYQEDIKYEDDENEIAELEGRMAIAKKLLTSRDFEFDSPETEQKAYENQVGILNPRSLKIALDASDGTKDDFIKEYPKACGPEQLQKIKLILSNYKDIDNKANSVFKKNFGKKNAPTAEVQQQAQDTSSSIFANKKQSMSADMLKNYMRDNGLSGYSLMHDER